MDFRALSIQSLIPKLQEDLKKIQGKVAAVIQEQLKIILMNGIKLKGRERMEFSREKRMNGPKVEVKLRIAAKIWDPKKASKAMGNFGTDFFSYEYPVQPDYL